MENWIWGLSLIALTMAIHGTGVLWIALVDVGIRGRIERQNRLRRRRHVAEFIIGMIAVVGLLLAALHGIEAALWAAAYWWLGALNSPAEAILYSIELDQHARRFRSGAGVPLEADGRTGGGGRHAAVRHQHGLHLHGDAELLATPHPAPVTGRGVKKRCN